jgi:hypothetical protein
VTGEYPVQAQTLDALSTAHRLRNCRPLRERRPDLPKPFVRVVDQALASDPRDRYADGSALLAALELVIRNRTRKSIASRLLFLVCSVGIAVCLSSALGALSSVAFNSTLGRSDFADENLRQWLIWGVKSTLAPAALLLIVWSVIMPLVGLQRLVVRQFAGAARLDATVRRHVNKYVRAQRIDDPSELSYPILGVCAAALLAAWWYFSPLIMASLYPIATSSREQLAMLAPGRVPHHEHYREAFTCLLFLTVGAWYAVTKGGAHRGRGPGRAIQAAWVAVVVLTLASLDLPYRLLWHNQFEAATWNGQDCYVIGERTADLLLFCPQLDPPRSRMVQNDRTNVHRPGLRENIFTRFSAVAEKGRPAAEQ